MTPPRIRGRVGRAEENGKQVGWAFELTLWTFDGTEMLDQMEFGIFGTEGEAHAAMRTSIQTLCESMAKHFGLDTKGYVDMQNGGVFRPWESH